MTAPASIAIVIPARYASTRFPGKPLAVIAGKTMLARVIDVARQAASAHGNVDILVTTEDERIAAHAAEIGAECIITSPDCPTGSDRVLEAVRKSGRDYDFIINLQGDAPFTPPEVIESLMAAFTKNPALDVVTPVHRLSWADLDRLRGNKKTTPFSGTTAIIAPDGRALWFSKNILPAIRREDRAQPLSPVYQHIGLYGYSRAALERFVTLPQSRYEALEGLEQLRLLENGIAVQTVEITVETGAIHAGIDSPEDLERAERLFQKRP